MGAPYALTTYGLKVERGSTLMLSRRIKKRIIAKMKNKGWTPFANCICREDAEMSQESIVGN